MPDLPRIWANPNLPKAPGPVEVPRDAFGYSAFRSIKGAADALADAFNKLDEASVEAESRRTIAMSQAEVEQRIKENDQQMVDPDEYHKQTSDQMKEVVNRYRDGIKDPRVLTKYNDAMAPYVIKSVTAIDMDRHKKRVNKARGDAELFMVDGVRRYSQAEGQKKIDIEKELVEFTRKMVETTAWGPEEGQKKILGIITEDQTNRAAISIETAKDPMKALAEIPKLYPMSDPYKLLEQLKRATTLQRQALEDAEKARKKSIGMAVDNDYIDVITGKLKPADIPERARRGQYPREDTLALIKAAEGGGINDADFELALDVKIRSGIPVDLRTIAAAPQLDNPAKRRLLGLRAEHMEEKHFSKSSEWSMMMKEIKAEIAPSGPFESMTKEENQKMSFALREMRERVGKGESPIAVGIDIKNRLAREPKKPGSSKPLFTPGFASPEALGKALRDGKIDINRFNKESQLFEQWEAYQAEEIKRQTGTRK